MQNEQQKGLLAHTDAHKNHVQDPLGCFLRLENFNTAILTNA